MAKVERIWFRQRAAGQAVEPMYDLSLGKDADYTLTRAVDAEADFARLRAEWQLADDAVNGFLFQYPRLDVWNAHWRDLSFDNVLGVVDLSRAHDDRAPSAGATHAGAHHVRARDRP